MLAFVRPALLLMAVSLVLPVCADERTQKLLARLDSEAAAFEETAPNLMTEETLHQRVLGAADGGKHRRFRPHVVRPGSQPAAPEWHSREIQSEYAYARAGNPPAIHEIRKVLAVDGKPVPGSKDAAGELMRAIQARGDRSRRKLLEAFEKHGLVGTVTDFGQLLLLFARAHQEEYEFYPVGEKLYGAQRCMVFLYRQQEGAGALTVWDEKGRSQPRVAGEIWVSVPEYRPVKITLRATQGAGAETVREEADVDYVPSEHGVVVPATVVHREYRNSLLTTENRFSYAPFRRFASSTTLQYSTEP
jgi:hypothetical protein